MSSADVTIEMERNIPNIWDRLFGGLKRGFDSLGSEDAGDFPRGATSETWPRRHHIGGATTRAHGAKDLTIVDMTEERMLKDLHKDANKREKWFDEMERGVHGPLNDFEKQKLEEWRTDEEKDLLGYGTKALKREFMLRQMAQELRENLKRMPKDELMRLVSPEKSFNIELEALERALGDPGGYELDPSIMNPRPEGFKHLPFRGKVRRR